MGIALGKAVTGGFPETQSMPVRSWDHVERALDIATNRVVAAADAFRERFRYRCLHASCRAFVTPCLGEQRQYFRHEQGSAWCPEMADEAGDGSPGDDRTRRVCRLLLNEQDDWSVEFTKLNALALACDLKGTDIGSHVHEVAAFARASEPIFAQPAFGGMQLADASLVYPGEVYFLLSAPGRGDPPEALRRIAIRQGSAKQGANLYRFALPRQLAPQLVAWFASVGLNVSPAARHRWQVDDDLNQPEDFTGATFSALLSSPETVGHHVSLFMESPDEASWSVLTWMDPDSFRLPKRFIDVVCRYERRPRGELYVRAESSLDLSGGWREKRWKASRTEQRREFIIHVGDGFAIRGQVVLPV